MSSLFSPKSLSLAKILPSRSVGRSAIPTRASGGKIWEIRSKMGWHGMPPKQHCSVARVWSLAAKPLWLEGTRRLTDWASRNERRSPHDACRIEVLNMSFQNFWLLFLLILIKMNLWIPKLKSSTDSHPFLIVSSSKNQLFIPNPNNAIIYNLWLVTTSVVKIWCENSNFVPFRWLLELISWYLRRLSMNDFKIDVAVLVLL